MMKRLIGLSLAALLAAGCHDKPAKLEVQDANGAKIAVTLPTDATAAQLIQLRGIADAALTLRADQQQKAAELALAQVARQERERYAFYLFLAVMFGIIMLSLTAMGIVIYLTKQVTVCKNTITSLL